MYHLLSSGGINIIIIFTILIGSRSNVDFRVFVCVVDTVQEDSTRDRRFFCWGVLPLIEKQQQNQLQNHLGHNLSCAYVGKTSTSTRATHIEQFMTQ